MHPGHPFRPTSASTPSDDDRGAGALELGHFARSSLTDGEASSLAAHDGTIGVRLAESAQQAPSARTSATALGEVGTPATGLRNRARLLKRTRRHNAAAPFEQDIKRRTATRPVDAGLHPRA